MYRRQFRLAQLFVWTTVVALWLSLFRSSGSWALPLILGVIALATYFDRRFSPRIPEKYLGLAVVGVAAILVLLLAIFPPMH